MQNDFLAAQAAYLKKQEQWESSAPTPSQQRSVSVDDFLAEPPSNVQQQMPQLSRMQPRACSVGMVPHGAASQNSIYSPSVPAGVNLTATPERVQPQVAQRSYSSGVIRGEPHRGAGSIYAPSVPSGVASDFLSPPQTPRSSSAGAGYPSSGPTLLPHSNTHAANLRLAESTLWAPEEPRRMPNRPVSSPHHLRTPRGSIDMGSSEVPGYSRAQSAPAEIESLLDPGRLLSVSERMLRSSERVSQQLKAYAECSRKTGKRRPSRMGVPLFHTLEAMEKAQSEHREKIGQLHRNLQDLKSEIAKNVVVQPNRHQHAVTSVSVSNSPRWGYQQQTDSPVTYQLDTLSLDISAANTTHHLATQASTGSAPATTSRERARARRAKRSNSYIRAEEARAAQRGHGTPPADANLLFPTNSSSASAI